MLIDRMRFCFSYKHSRDAHVYIWLKLKKAASKAGPQSSFALFIYTTYSVFILFLWSLPPQPATLTAQPAFE